MPLPSLPAYSKLDQAHGSEASASVDLHAALPAPPSWRSAQRLKAMLVTGRVFAIVGCVLAAIALALNVAAMTVKVTAPRYFPCCYSTYRVPFTFLSTSAMWFGILHVGVCVTALLFIRKLLKGQFSNCLAVTGILVSVLSGILAGGTLFTCISSSVAALEYKSVNLEHVWYALFATVSVLSGLTFVADLALCVFMTIAVSMAAGCCCACQPAYIVDVTMQPPASIVYTPSQPA